MGQDLTLSGATCSFWGMECGEKGLFLETDFKICGKCYQLFDVDLGLESESAGLNPGAVHEKWVGTLSS